MRLHVGIMLANAWLFNRYKGSDIMIAKYLNSVQSVVDLRIYTT